MFNESFHSFALNTHQLYIFKHCINIVSTLRCREIILIHWCLYFELKNKIIWVSLDCPFWYVLSPGSEFNHPLCDRCARNKTISQLCPMAYHWNFNMDMLCWFTGYYHILIIHIKGWSCVLVYDFIW